MGKQKRKFHRAKNILYERKGGSIFIVIEDENFHKLATYKAGLNDKELINRILQEISDKYGYNYHPPKEISHSLFDIDEDEAQKNKDAISQFGTKVKEAFQSLGKNKEELKKED